MVAISTGYVGATGRADGCPKYLHFRDLEAAGWLAAVAIDPLPLLRAGDKLRRSSPSACAGGSGVFASKSPNQRPRPGDISKEK